MSFFISDGDYIRFNHDGKLMAVMIREDMEPSNPRQYYDNLGKMICWHRSYRLGDDHEYQDTEDFFRQLVREMVPWDVVVQAIKDGKTNLRIEKIEDEPEFSANQVRLVVDYVLPWKGSYELCAAATLEELFSSYNDALILDELTTSEMYWLLQQRQNIVLMPLWLYDHSGISMSTSYEYPYSDRWDGGQVGWIYLTKDKFLSETGYGESGWPKKACEILKAEVETYDQYLRGEVFGYQLFEFNRNDTDEWDETEEDCWGFYGDDLMENGILDCIDGLREAVKSGNYTTGKAREVVTTSYEFD